MPTVAAAAGTLVATLFFVGCVRISDVDRSATYPTEYAVGNIYECVRPVFLERNGFIVPPGMNGGVPASPKQYFDEGRAHWPDIVAVIPAATRLVITSVKLEKNPEVGNSVWVSAEILGIGKTRPADLVFVSLRVHQRKPAAVIPHPNPEFLRAVP